MAAITELSQVNIIDFDVYGRSSNIGGALIHQNDFAISNAIIFFLTSAKGDYLYNPTEGGILQSLLYKLLDQKYVNYYTNQIIKILELKFGSLISSIDVQITSDFEKRMYVVDVFFKSKQTGVVNQVEFNTRPIVRETATITIVDVNLSGDNLLGFVLLQLGYPDQVREKLLLNSEDGKWYWGRFRLNEFSENSDNFDQIFETINGFKREG